ncbi:putative parvulin-type peptidyl-prolyl cis-trans isomerase [Betaproteobacteria bacterium]|nr:putative parvulin-type peptidyl-prolyl cis-trans isomerase [Betaproteobacteria bacterium]GHU45947.1 putative parvulin-type peptidyl-prolyl cis-trans isomerase [Betaproteobacteria bacterium]
MQKCSRFSTALIVAALIIAPAWAADLKPGTAVTVNGYAISRTVESALIEEQIARGAKDSPEFRTVVHDELIRRALLLNEARKKQLDKLNLIKGQMESASQLVLIRAFLTDYLKNNPVTTTEIQQIYDAFVLQLGTRQYKVRHILLGTENEAQALIARLNAGENFADLARSLSLDTASKEKGGDLGWKVPSAFVAPISTALKQLEKGQYSTSPIQTTSGFNVIYLEDVDALTPPAIEELTPQLTEKANQQKIEKLISELLKNAKIK